MYEAYNVHIIQFWEQNEYMSKKIFQHVNGLWENWLNCDILVVGPSPVNSIMHYSQSGVYCAIALLEKLVLL